MAFLWCGVLLYLWCVGGMVLPGLPGLPGFTEGWVILKKQIVGCDLLLLIVMIRIESSK